MLPEIDEEGGPVGAASETHKKLGLEFHYLSDLMRGAAVTGLVLSRPSGDLTISFTGNRNLTVKRLDEGYTLHFNGLPEGNYIPPVPIIFTQEFSAELHETINILQSIEELHAVMLLLLSGREGDLRKLLSLDTTARAATLLDSSERLRIISVSHGSWVGEFWANSKKSFEIIRTLGLSISEEGRNIIRRREEAKTQIQEAEAEKSRHSARRERASALKEELEVSKNLVEFWEKKIQCLDKHNPIRQKFEDEYVKIDKYIESDKRLERR